MKSLGLDLSLSSTGFCVIADSFIVKHGVIKTDKKTFKGEAELIRRTDFIVNEIVDIMNTFVPEVIVIEGYAMGANGRVFDLAELGGKVKTTLYHHRDEGYRGAIYTCPPSSLKMAFQGKGNASKEQMIECAQDYSFYTDDNNVADAFFLALAGYAVKCVNYKSHPWNKPQIDLTEKMKQVCSSVVPRRRR